MPKWKMPPKAKVYEALSAIADDRVEITDDTHAQVQSSERDKTYSLEWSADFKSITSDDNASYWQGYIGYPIIAVLMVLGRITYREDLAAKLADVPWKRLNTKFKRDYDKAVDSVLADAEEKGADRSAIVEQAEEIYRQLGALKLERKGPAPRRR